MDIGPTDLPIQPLIPSEGIRRVERRSDAKEYPQHRQPEDERSENEEREAPHDSVDVSVEYRLAQQEPELSEDPVVLMGGPVAAERHLDIEA